MSDVNTLDFKFHWDFEKGVFEEPANLNELTKDENFELELEFYDEQKQEDKLWMARTGLNYDTLCGAVETIVFMSDKPVSLIKIKNQIDEDLPLRVIHEAISKLQNDYEMKHHGIRLQEVAEGYQFRTKATYSKFVQSMFKVNAIVLSPTALEVLAMIAYKQPVSRVEIDKIRGVDSSHIIRGLMDRRLVKVVGRTEEAGKPAAYGTTDEFLEVFNMSDLSQLPPEYELDEIASGNAFGKIQDIKNIVSVGDKMKFDFDELAELDELSQNIQNISSDTLFTRTLDLENKRRNEGEATEKKSAFDILEEFVVHDETLKQNKLACSSDTPMNVVEPRIVDLIKEDGLINAPEVDDEYMNDLDEKIDELSSNVHNVLEAHGLNVENLLNGLNEQEENISEAVDELFGSDEKLAQEAKELEDALDEAFDNLMGSRTDFDELEDAEADEKIEESEKNLEDALNSFTEKAKDMDLDLDFLAEEAKDSNELDENNWDGNL